ncbi:hypothetical protein D3C78_926110 [compost metagenome]
MIRFLRHLYLSAVMLICLGIDLFAAWLPDIVSSLLNNRSLELIEVYTTEITYVLDMGIINPLMLLCLYMLKRKNGLGDITLIVMLRLCSVIGLMLPVQTIFQLLAGIELSVPVLISKMGIFVILAFFAVYYDKAYYKRYTCRYGVVIFGGRYEKSFSHWMLWKR